MLKVVCVLKSGGDYNSNYVVNLYDMVVHGLSRLFPFTFICLTDLSEAEFVGKPEHVVIIPLRDNLRGWWSKIEMFRIQGPAIYLDLDTAVLKGGSLVRLASAVLETREPLFCMLKAFNPKERWASGMMAWAGNCNWRFIYNEFDRGCMQVRWDQRYIKSKLEENKVEITAVQEYVNIHSYKYHCKKGLPKDAEVVCFHGKPRPHEVGPPYFTVEGGTT